MKRCLLPTAAIGLTSFCLAGCSDMPERVSVPAMDPASIGSQALAAYDADKDGAIAAAELDACPGLKRGLTQIDANNDSRLTAEEVAARIRRYQDDRLGIIGFNGFITMDGQPLEGALVTLEPETFMGSSIEPAEATSDAGGVFQPTTPGVAAGLFGARAGIYRIKVSKKDAKGGETIPARYNSQTTLGVELGSDSPVCNQGLELALSSRQGA
jgi:hypothetical protein